MKWFIESPIAVMAILASVCAIGLEATARDTAIVWSGNVHVLGIGRASDGSVTLDFMYADGKIGYTNSGDVVNAFANHTLPWLYCDVSRTHKGVCRVGGSK